MKEYKSNEELINYLLSKGVVISNKKDALEKVERYTYYSIVNTYKNIFKDKNGNYIENVSFDDIYALFEFDKNLKNIILKYCLEIETVIKSDNITNLYMVVRCMEKLLTKEQYKELYNSICEETRKLEEKLKSVEINNITKIMGFPMNNN